MKEFVKFEDVNVYDVVEINDTYDNTCAVGIVMEKVETGEYKGVRVMYGFDRNNLKPVVLEYKVAPRGEQTLFVTNILH